MTIGINEGTQTSLKSTTDTGEEISHVRVDGGTVGVLSTVTTVSAVSSVSNLVTGTVARLGTIQNVIFGTFDTFYRHPDRFATVISSGTSDMGTIKPAVSGSAIYVTDVVVSVGSASNVEIASGGTSTPIMGTMHLGANGGAVMNFRTPISTASGSALVYKQSANIPLTISVQGYVD